MLVGTRFTEHDGEFVTTESSQDIVGAETPAEALRNDGQQRITRFVTECVVDVLESVEIDQHQVVPREMRTVLEFVEQRTPVRKPRELIRQRLRGDLHQPHLLCCHVDAEPAEVWPFVVHHHARDVADPDPPTVGRAQPDDPVDQFAGHHIVGIDPEIVDVVGVHDVAVVHREPFVARPSDHAGNVADHVDHPTLEIREVGQTPCGPQRVEQITSGLAHRRAGPMTDVPETGSENERDRDGALPLIDVEQSPRSSPWPRRSARTRRRSA